MTVTVLSAGVPLGTGVALSIWLEPARYIGYSRSGELKDKLRAAFLASILGYAGKPGARSGKWHGVWCAAL